MGRDTIQLETVISTIFQEYLLDFTSEYGILEDLHPKLPGPEERIVDFPEGKVDMDLFNLIRTPNPTKVKIGTCPRAAHEETVAPKVPPQKNVTTTGVAPETGVVEEITTMGPRVIKECRRRGYDGVDANSPPKKSVAQVARQDQRIRARKNEIKNLKALLEAETDMKKVTEAKKAELVMELENLRAQFTDLQVSNDRLSQQVGEALCEMDARLDALSIDFDEELYPHMLTAIASRQWVIGHGLCLAIMKCGESTELRQVFADVVSTGIAKGMSEGLKYGVEHGKANLDLEAIEAYYPEADTKYVAAIHTLRDLKYHMVDQLKSLKDALIDVIMASLHLESDSGKDAPQDIVGGCHCGQRKSYQEEKEMSGDMSFPWVGSAHHARSDGVPVSVPTVTPQGLAILLADAATQTETSENEASPRSLRSKSLPAMYKLDWP
nr:hypothetical protein [Tanacetum cinerariifolium]